MSDSSRIHRSIRIFVFVVATFALMHNGWTPDWLGRSVLGLAYGESIPQSMLARDWMFGFGAIYLGIVGALAPYCYWTKASYWAHVKHVTFAGLVGFAMGLGAGYLF
jgi:hypothetical protein